MPEFMYRWFIKEIFEEEPVREWEGKRRESKGARSQAKS